MINTCLILFLFLTAEDLFMAASQEREQESVWVCGYLSLSFRCFILSERIRFDKAEFNINVITGGFFFFSLQPGLESGVYLVYFR